MKKYIINIILISSVYAECYELDYNSCLEYPQYCEWNDESNQCQEIGSETGGGTTGGGGSGVGPYDYNTITESDGLRNGPDYRDGVVYYPIGGSPP